MITANGSAAGRITYGAYGDPTSPLPLLLGSTEEDAPAHWTNIGGNVWTTTSPLNSVTASGSNLLPNPSFPEQRKQLGLLLRPGIERLRRPKHVRVPKRAGLLQVALHHRERHGRRFHSIVHRPLQHHRKPVLQAHVLGEIDRVLQPAADCLGRERRRLQLVWSRLRRDDDHRHSYQQYTVLFREGSPPATPGSRLVWGRSAAGKDFYLDTLSLQACKPNDGVALMDNDVGNIIYNNDAGAYKRFVLTDQGSSPDYYHTGLHNQGDFYYNPGNWTVEVYSTSNPASYYSDIEVARGEIIVVGGSYVTISNLAVQYGSQSGFYFANQHDFTVSHCDLSWIGGSEQGTSTAMAIPFASETVSRRSTTCRMCLSRTVGSGRFTTALLGIRGLRQVQSNITFRNNIIWDCHGDLARWWRTVAPRTASISITTPARIPASAGQKPVRPDTGNS